MISGGRLLARLGAGGLSRVRDLAHRALLAPENVLPLLLLLVKLFAKFVGVLGRLIRVHIGAVRRGILIGVISLGLGLVLGLILGLVLGVCVFLRVRLAVILEATTAKEHEHTGLMQAARCTSSQPTGKLPGATTP